MLKSKSMRFDTWIDEFEALQVLTISAVTNMKLELIYATEGPTSTNAISSHNFQRYKKVLNLGREAPTYTQGS